MKKLTLLAAILGFAISAQAATTTKTTTTSTTTTSESPMMPLGITAIGYDANLKHITARLGLGDNAVDVGMALNFNSGATVDKVQVGLSGFYLYKLQDWGMVKNYLIGGGDVKIYSDSDLGLELFAGLQPEITLMDHFILSVRFGLNVPILPDFALQTAGQPFSVVNGLNFKVIW